MKVAILGCGPAGLLAAHAAVQADCTVDIFAPVKPSVIHGAMYLHRPIPGLTSEIPDANMHIFKRGSREGYAKKVYGDPNAPVSWDKFEPGEAMIWYLDKAYQELWDRYSSLISNYTVNPRSKGGFHELDSMTCDYSLVVSTIPAPALCSGMRECQFESQPISILKHQWCPPDEYHLTNRYNLMTYSGQLSEAWYRHSDIRGLASWEFSGARPESVVGPEGSEWVDGIKPLRGHCMCWPMIGRMGRFGAWDKHQLSHHAYEKMQEVLQRAL